MAKGKIDAKLIKNEKTKIVNVDEVNGVNASTLYSPIKVFEDCSKIICTSVNTPTGCSRMHMDSPPT